MSFSALATLPCLRPGRVGHTASLVGSQVVVWGGYDGKSRLDPQFAMCVSQDEGGAYKSSEVRCRASSGNTLPASRSAHTATALDEFRMLVLGGCTDPKVPAIRGASDGGSFISAGSSAVSPFLSDAWILDTSLWSWTDVSATACLPRPCAGHTTTLLGDYIVCFGGWAGDRDAADSATHIMSASELRWLTAGSDSLCTVGADSSDGGGGVEASSQHTVHGRPPSPRSGHTATAVGGAHLGWNSNGVLGGARKLADPTGADPMTPSVLVFGGWDGRHCLNDLHVLTPAPTSSNVDGGGTECAAGVAWCWSQVQLSGAGAHAGKPLPAVSFHSAVTAPPFCSFSFSCCCSCGSGSGRSGGTLPAAGALPSSLCVVIVGGLCNPNESRGPGTVRRSLPLLFDLARGIWAPIPALAHPPSAAVACHDDGSATETGSGSSRPSAAASLREQTLQHKGKCVSAVGRSSVAAVVTLDGTLLTFGGTDGTAYCEDRVCAAHLAPVVPAPLLFGIVDSVYMAILVIVVISILIAKLLRAPVVD